MSEPTETYGVLYNPRCGGFGFSMEALLWLVERGHPLAITELEQQTHPTEGWMVNQWSQQYLGDVDRDDPLAIECVRTLGKAASGPHADLTICEVPVGSNWDIESHSGDCEEISVWPRAVRSRR